MRKTCQSALVVAAVVIALCGCGRQQQPKPVVEKAPTPEEKILTVYDRAEYTGADQVGSFTQKTGIQVNYRAYDSDNVLRTKLLVGGSDYDVVVPSAPILMSQVKAGTFMTLDKSKLPNLKNMDPTIMRRLAQYDPGNEHAIPYVWGTTGIGYNPDEVKAVLGSDRIDSWATIFDPKNASKLKDCGLVMLDSPIDVFDSVLIYLGKDPNAQDPDDLKLAEDVMMKIRPYIRYVDSSRYANDLAQGEVCVALGRSREILQARSRDSGAGVPARVAYAIPDEGAPMWIDAMAIPADAPHPGNAIRFMDFIMDPSVAAATGNSIPGATGNAASVPLLDPAVRNDASIHPPPAVETRLHPMLVPSQDYGRQLDLAWAAVRGNP